MGTPWGTAVTVKYNEGAEVGYRWFSKLRHRPLYAFGHGVSYTTFDYDELDVSGGDTITATFSVTIAGDRKGADVPQLHLAEAAGDRRTRLFGFERVELSPGEARRVSLSADPRLLARFDADAGQWCITEATYAVAVGRSAGERVLEAQVTLTGRLFGR